MLSLFVLQSPKKLGHTYWLYTSWSLLLSAHLHSSTVHSSMHLYYLYMHIYTILSSLVPWFPFWPWKNLPFVRWLSHIVPRKKNVYFLASHVELPDGCVEGFNIFLIPVSSLAVWTGCLIRVPSTIIIALSLVGGLFVTWLRRIVPNDFPIVHAVSKHQSDYSI